MFRYIAIVWDHKDPTQEEAVRVVTRRIRSALPDWSPVGMFQGLRAYVNSVEIPASEPCLLQENSGVVLGTVFRGGVIHSPYTRCTNFSRVESSTICESRGRALIDSYWGRYVGFVLTQTDGSINVVRDPSGAIRCHRFDYEGISIYCSAAEDAASLDLVKFTIDWEYVRTRLVIPQMETRETIVREITNVLAGECVSHQGNSKTNRFYWDPQTVLEARRVTTLSEASDEVRRIGLATIHAWASCFDSVVHQISGGIDSSVVLGALSTCARSKPRITCMTYYSEGPDSDERDFARLAATRAGCRLEEFRRPENVDLSGMFNDARLAQPLFFPRDLIFAPLEQSVAAKVDATGFFNGTGGDGVFFQNPMVESVADFRRARGPRPSTFGMALDVARHEELSVWRVLRACRASLKSASRWNPFEGDEQRARLVPDEIVRSVIRDRRFLHPWFSSLRDLPPGKLWHIYHISIPAHLDNPCESATAPLQVEVLLSQPLVEICLQIPTYLHSHAGWDRAVARSAFAQELPREIRTRTTKGGVEEYATRVLMNNLSLVRQTLRDGALFAEGVLDPAKLNHALSLQPSAAAPEMLEMFKCLCMEACIHNWRRPARSQLARSGS